MKSLMSAFLISAEPRSAWRRPRMPRQRIDTTKRIKVAMVPKLIGLSVFKANEQGAIEAAKA